MGQEPVLFDTSVAENISLGKQEASKEAVEMAAKDANAHEFISSMPEGYSTHVGKYSLCIEVHGTLLHGLNVSSQYIHSTIHTL